MLTTKNKFTLLLIIICFFFAAILSAALFSTQKIGMAIAREFSSDEDFVFNAEKEAAYDGVSFEYKITSGADTVVNICILDGKWANYYGYFEFGVSGATEDYDGVLCESIADGYVSVSIRFNEVTVHSGKIPSATAILYSRSLNTTANGIIKNVVFFEDSEAEQVKKYDGRKYYADRNAYINAPVSRLYEKVIFEYKVAKTGDEDSFGICLLDDYNTNYFGYYYFDSHGIKSGYKNDGVTVTELSDGYLRVVMSVPELKRTNNQNGTKNAPKKIRSIFLRDVWMQDDVYIRNVSFSEQSTFSMCEGAAVRLEKPYGIKFKAKIPRSGYDETALYGMLIIPAAYINEYSLTDNYLDKLKASGAEYKNAYLKVKVDDDLDYFVESYLIGIDENDLDTEYVGIAYKEKDNTVTYAENINACVRAVRSVSEKAVKAVTDFWDYAPDGQDLLREIVGCDNEALDDFEVFGFDSNENFKKDQVVPSSKKLSLSAAKGESESGEIILSAFDAVDCKTYIITPNDLVHEDGRTVLSKNCFSFYNGNYILVDSNYRQVVYPKNNQATDLGTGYRLCDALVPFSTAVGAGETAFDCTNGANHTILVDISVPVFQKAGKYTGEFRIDVLGVGYRTIAVEFNVYDFILPSENNAKTIFAIPTNYLKDVFGTEAGYDSELYRELYDFLLEYNVCGGRLPEVTGYGEDGWQKYLNVLIDYAADPRVSTINLYSGYSLVTYEYSYTYEEKFLLWTQTKTKTETYTDLIVLDEYDRKGSYVNNAGETVVYDNYGLRTIFKKIAEYSIDSGINLFEKIVVNSPQNDEPSDPRRYAEAMLSYNAVRRSIDYVLNGAGLDWSGREDIKASLDDVPFLVTVAPKDEVVAGNKILDNVLSSSAFIPADENNERKDIIIEYKNLKDFIALVADYDASDNPTEYSRLMSYIVNSPEHTHVWWYTCCLSVNPYYNYGVNSDRVKMRSNRWAQFGMGIEGELYCSVNNWFIMSDNEEITVLTESEIWQGKSNQAGLIEDGVLVYPNVHRYEDVDFRFVATYRLYAIRESIDDYNYLCLAQKLISDITDATERQRNQALLDSIVSDLYSGARTVTGDADAVRHARAEIVNLITELN